MKTGLSHLLLILFIAGCATKPKNQPAPTYSDFSSEGTPSAATPSTGPAAGPQPAAQPKVKPAETDSAKKGAAPVLTQVAAEKLDPALLQPSAEPFVLGPGDTLELELLGTAASRSSVTVGLDGKIYFHLLPGLDVSGLTLDQARELLEQELGKFLTAPQVSVTLRGVGSRYVWLLGRLTRPGIYPLPGTMTLLESLALAGGAARSATAGSTEQLADLRHSFVMRQGKLLPVDFYRLL